MAVTLFPNAVQIPKDEISEKVVTAPKAYHGRSGSQNDQENLSAQNTDGHN